MRFAVHNAHAVYCPMDGSPLESRRYLQRPWCQFECRSALDRGVFWSASHTAAYTRPGRRRVKCLLCLYLPERPERKAVARALKTAFTTPAAAHSFWAPMVICLLALYAIYWTAPDTIAVCLRVSEVCLANATSSVFARPVVSNFSVGNASASEEDGCGSLANTLAFFSSINVHLVCFYIWILATGLYVSAE